ncbi:hypothetical protein M2650_03985 [Luteimonas sp. SX5]|uniref:DUF998 domain-containing protein n=1 Tax=Luteimonas galliterrae TaxID=2940486 RepID=A0ABT0MG06_9GAMM|nr:hypothetical protein [Luteimonas galliterrae]MCL1633806.1 hypothetical protein [Luteimonas galliterrae]
MERIAAPLWPLPLAIALVMLVATHLAWMLSVQAGYVPLCNPYWDGCTSISRAARHGLGNHLFRLMMLPCAVLQGLHWWSARDWLRLQRPGANGGGALLPLGIGAALSLAVYATFLGTEGEVYRFLRRYGVIVYFACSYLAQLVFLRQLRRRGLAQGPLPGVMLVICVTMLLLGVINAVLAAVASERLKDVMENALEWQFGILLVAWFVAQAWLWRRSGYAFGFRSDS